MFLDLTIHSAFQNSTLIDINFEFLNTQKLKSRGSLEDATQIRNILFPKNLNLKIICKTYYFLPEHEGEYTAYT